MVLNITILVMVKRWSIMYLPVNILPRKCACCHWNETDQIVGSEASAVKPPPNTVLYIKCRKFNKKYLYCYNSFMVKAKGH